MAKNRKTDFGYIEEAVLDIEVEPAPEMRDYPKRAAARRKAREKQAPKEPAESRAPREVEDQSNYLSGPSVGVLFRQARLKLKRDVNDIAQMLRIRKEYLQAIEDGRYGDLPGHTYAIGFVRGDAGNRGLDPEEIVQKFKEETGNAEPQPELVMPTPVQEKRSSGLGILVVLVVLGGVLYGAWHFLAPKVSSDGGGSASTSGTSSSGSAASGGAAGATEASSAGSSVGGAGNTGEAGSTAGSAGATGTAGTTGTTGTTGEASGGSGSTGEVAAGGSAGSTASGAAGGGQVATANRKVVLKATGGDAWIRISDAQGRILLQRILRRGASYEVPSEQSGLTLLVGNAGALEAVIGGKTIGPIGPRGIVRRNVPLDPAKLEAAIKAP